MSLLDEIVFGHEQFGVVPPVMQSMNLGVELGGEYGARRMILGGPWLVGSTFPQKTAGRWPDLCARLAERNLLVACHAKSFEGLSAAPRRLATQTIGFQLELDDLQAADLVELKCQTIEGRWGWPPEIQRPGNWPDWLDTVRSVLGSTTPLGLGLCAGADDASLRVALSSGIHFIAVHHVGALELLIDTLSRANRLRQQAGLRVAIIARTKARSAADLTKLLALGADLVTIDEYLEESWQQSSQKSYLGITLPTSGTTTTCPIGRKLDELQTELESTLTAADATTIVQLRKAVIALTESAARIATIRMIGK